MLHGIGFLRVFTDDDRAIENTLRVSVKNALIQLTTRCMRLPVIDNGVIIDETFAAG